MQFVADFVMTMPSVGNGYPNQEAIAHAFSKSPERDFRTAVVIGLPGEF